MASGEPYAIWSLVNQLLTIVFLCLHANNYNSDDLFGSFLQHCVGRRIYKIFNIKEKTFFLIHSFLLK